MKHVIIGFFCVLLIAVEAQAGRIVPELQATLLDRAPDEDVAVIIQFSDRLDVTASGEPNLNRRRSNLIKGLKQKADQVQQRVQAMLIHRGVKRLTQLWLINGMAATVRANMVDDLTRQPGVESVRLDAEIALPTGTSRETSLPVGWNLTAIEAPALWTLGFDGDGVVVATMDTGVDVDHPALALTWRGGANSWFDPHGEHRSPTDLNGHGTQTMGIIVAGVAGSQAIGIAPGAQWIAVKIFNDADVAMLSDVHQGFQWLLDPDGDPDTDDSADIINNSWTLYNTVNRCDLEFQPDIDALRAAGIAVVFAAGNAEPNTGSSTSPADNPGSLAVGAVDETLSIYPFSDRGPSACDFDMFPGLVAPGVNVKTTDLSFGGLFMSPVEVTGTSFAAPHVAGGLAVLKSAFRDVTLPELEAAITETALDLGDPGPDNVYGAGLLDLVAAYHWLLSNIPSF